MNYAIYLEVPGRILRTINCDASVIASIPLQEDELYLEVSDDINDLTHYIAVGPVATVYPPKPSEYHVFDFALLDWVLRKYLLLYLKATGKVTSIIRLEGLNPEDYETVDIGAVLAATSGEYDPESREIYLDPLPPDPDLLTGGIVPIEGEPGYPTEENYTWNWATHVFEPNKAQAFSLANTRVRVGQEAMKYGTFTWSGNVFQADVASQGQISGNAFGAFVAQSSSTPFSVDWTLANNTVITLDDADMLAVFAAMQANNTSAQGQGTALRTDIATANSLPSDADAVTALNAIVWVAP